MSKKVNQYQKSQGKFELNENDYQRMKEKAASAATFENLDLGPVSKYNNEDKLYAVVTWLLTKNLHRVSNITEIPIDTIRHWKYRAGWWDQAVHAVMAVKNEELDHRLTDMIDNAVDSLQDRLQNGDDHVLRDGTIVKKNVSARDLMIILGTTYDKRALMRGDPTARTENKKDTDEKLDKLTNAFKDIANTQKDVVQTQPKEVENAEQQQEDVLFVQELREESEQEGGS